MTHVEHSRMANAIRGLAMDAVEKAKSGHPGLPLDEIKRFRQLGSKTPGHPENFHTKGIETTTGPLGQGLATSIGMAVAEKMLAAEFGKKVVDHHTYVLASDGDLMEGVSQEAIAL